MTDTSSPSTATSSLPREPRDRARRALPAYVVPALVLLATAAVLVIAVAGVLATPAARSADAPATAFSAVGARAALGDLVTGPHPIGSAEHDRVRDALVARLSAIGLRPSLRPGAGVADERGAAVVGQVTNIEATLPGRAPTGRILLVAHYDSVPGGPGASDDGIGLGSILEVLRALKQGPAPRNDITVLFTDSEESGLLGARSYAASLAEPGPPTVVLNLEARGTSGRAVMFETGLHNASLLPALRDHLPVATSLSDEVYHLLPNDTDFTALRQAGTTGMNFAVIGGSANYHTERDNLANLDDGSLQDLGSAVLGAAGRLGDVDLATVARSSDATYFAIGPILVWYPTASVLPLAAFAAAGLAGALWWGRRRRSVRLGGVAVTVATLPLPLLAAALIGFGGWQLLTLIRPDYEGFAFGNPYRTGLTAAGLVVLTVVVVWLYLLLRRRRCTAVELMAGVTTGFTLLAVVTAILLPGASYLFVWPSLSGVLALFLAAGLPPASRWQPALPVLLTLPAAALLGPVAVLLFDAVGLAFALVPLVVVSLCAVVVLTPAARRLPRRGVAATTAVVVAAGAGLVGGGLRLDPAGTTHPAQVNLLYTLDADTGGAYWAADGSGHHRWYSPYESGTSVRLADTFPSLTRPQRWSLTPAPVAAVAVPTLTVAGSAVEGELRTLRLKIATTGGQPYQLQLYVDPGASGAVVRASTAGAAGLRGGTTLAEPFRPWRWGLIVVAPPAEGTDVTLVVRGGPVRVRVVAKSAGPPESVRADPRPATVIWSAGAGVAFATRLYRI